VFVDELKQNFQIYCLFHICFSRQHGFTLLVALDTDGKAQGDLFWDDGNSVDTAETGNYFHANFKAERVGMLLWFMEQAWAYQRLENPPKHALIHDKINEITKFLSWDYVLYDFFA